MMIRLLEKWVVRRGDYDYIQDRYEACRAELDEAKSDDLAKRNESLRAQLEAKELVKQSLILERDELKSKNGSLERLNDTKAKKILEIGGRLNRLESAQDRYFKIIRKTNSKPIRYRVGIVDKNGKGIWNQAGRGTQSLERAQKLADTLPYDFYEGMWVAR